MMDLESRQRLASITALVDRLPSTPPIACIHVGVDTTATAVRLEKFAYNCARGRDVGGWTPAHGLVTEADPMEHARSTVIGRPSLYGDVQQR